MKKELAITLVFITMALIALPKLDYHTGPWLNPVVLPGEYEAAVWAQNVRGLFMAGIFGGELVMGMSGNPSLIGGDWAANQNAAQQMSDVEEFYTTDSADRAVELMQQYNASYAWFPSRDVYCGYGWKRANEEKMKDARFEVVYTNPEVRVYRLRSTT